MNKTAITALNNAIAIAATLGGPHTGYRLALKVNTIADELDRARELACGTEAAAIVARANKLEDQLDAALAR